MFIEIIHSFLEILIDTNTADMFTSPLALLLVFMLMFLIFTLFSGTHTKRLVLICIFVVVLIFAVFSIASHMGFITLPITFGGI